MVSGETSLEAGHHLAGCVLTMPLVGVDVCVSWGSKCMCARACVCMCAGADTHWGERESSLVSILIRTANLNPTVSKPHHPLSSFNFHYLLIGALTQFSQEQAGKRMTMMGRVVEGGKKHEEHSKSSEEELIFFL